MTGGRQDDEPAGPRPVSTYFQFLLLGLGNGGVFAALAMALVVTYRSSGVLNFATGAQALYAAYTYSLLRNGQLLSPIPGLEPDHQRRVEPGLLAGAARSRWPSRRCWVRWPTCSSSARCVTTGPSPRRWPPSGSWAC